MHCMSDCVPGMRDSILGDAEFIIEACDGQCSCDMAKIVEGGEPCVACQCTAAAKNIKASLSNAPREGSPNDRRER